ncbi:MAG: hypothetical protein KBE91_05585 [Bacteroidia bacterium]|nr:hypothetical protein [Bacteroidia bacterium]MBP9689065.1 hypothetical protein [Bacteroidia bacterium]
MKKLLIALLTSISFVTTSCLKDITDSIDDISSIKGVTTNPTLATPVFYSTVNLGNLVSDVSGKIDLSTDINRKFLLKFSTSDSLEPKQYTTIPNINFGIDLIMPPSEVPNFVANGYFSQSIANDEPITITGIRAERVLIKTGSLRLTVGSEFKHNTVVKVSYPGITKNGIAFIDSFVFEYNGTTPTPIIRNLNLAGYEIDFTKNGSTYNTFAYELGVNITRNPANNVDITDKISVSQDIRIPAYKRIEGYLGKFVIAKLKQSNVLDLFKDKVEGDVFIKNPIINLRIDNSFGLPITAKITDIYIESELGVKIPILINQFKDTFLLDYTTNIDQIKTTNYIIDNTNSNIDDVLNAAPQRVVYELEFTANNDDIPKPNVLYDYTTIKQTSILNLPADFKILNYILQSEGDFTLGNTTNDLDSSGVTINWVDLFSEITNGMPLNAEVQVYVDDTITNTVIDSVFSPPYLIQAAKVDAQGTVIEDTKALVISNISNQRYTKLSKGQKYRLNVRLKTAESSPGNAPFVSFYDYYNLSVKLGVKANITYRSKPSQNN